MKNRYLSAISTVAISFFIISSANASLVVSENFEDGVLDPSISIQTTGTFSSNPGIKSFSSIDGEKAFGFGRSTCGASCFENYATDIVISFVNPTPVKSISFSEMEVFGNWGSSGRVIADGVLISNYFGFGRLPSNDNVADTAFRNHTFDINSTVNQIVLHVHDITNTSEIYIDNIVVSAVPIPGAVWLFGSSLLGLLGISRKKIMGG